MLSCLIHSVTIYDSNNAVIDVYHFKKDIVSLSCFNMNNYSYMDSNGKILKTKGLSFIHNEHSDLNGNLHYRNDPEEYQCSGLLLSDNRWCNDPSVQLPEGWCEHAYDISGYQCETNMFEDTTHPNSFYCKRAVNCQKDVPPAPTLPCTLLKGQKAGQKGRLVYNVAEGGGRRPPPDRENPITCSNNGIVTDSCRFNYFGEFTPETDTVETFEPEGTTPNKYKMCINKQKGEEPAPPFHPPCNAAQYTTYCEKFNSGHGLSYPNLCCEIIQ